MIADVAIRNTPFHQESRLISSRILLFAGKYETAAKLMDLLQHAASDAWLSLGLSFYLSVLPLTRQLSEVSGSLWTRALQVGLPASPSHPFTNEICVLKRFDKELKLTGLTAGSWPLEVLQWLF